MQPDGPAHNSPKRFRIPTLRAFEAIQCRRKALRPDSTSHLLPLTSSLLPPPSPLPYLRTRRDRRIDPQKNNPRVRVGTENEHLRPKIRDLPRREIRHRENRPALEHRRRVEVRDLSTGLLDAKLTKIDPELVRRLPRFRELLHPDHGPGPNIDLLEIVDGDLAQFPFSSVIRTSPVCPGEASPERAGNQNCDASERRISSTAITHPVRRSSTE